MTAAAWTSARMIVSQLTGSWSLERRISGGVIMGGTALFATGEADGLLYRETVRVKLPDGGELDGERRYIFKEAVGGFDVLFCETPLRLFHHVEPARLEDRLRGGAIHYCGADTYESIYDFIDDGTFTVRHLVSGPKKDYLIETQYRREP